MEICIVAQRFNHKAADFLRKPGTIRAFLTHLHIPCSAYAHTNRIVAAKRNLKPIACLPAQKQNTGFCNASFEVFNLIYIVIDITGDPRRCV